MIQDFYKNRKYLDNEFEKAHWNVDSGQDPHTLSENLKRIIDQNQDLPMPLLRAHAFDYLLTHAQIEINPYNIFPDKINIGIQYSNSAEIGKNTASHDLFAPLMFHRFNAEIQQREIPKAYQKNKMASRLGIGGAHADYWHALPDWNNLFKYGFPGLLKRAENEKNKKITEHRITDSERSFYDSIIISYRAILTYIERLHVESKKYDLHQYTECLSNLLKGPPQTLYELLEFVYLFISVFEIGVERARSLGLIDRLYYPYYLADIKSGRITEDETKEMFRYFFNKYSAAKRAAAQPFSLCGTYQNGKDATNELTYLILDVYGELGNLNPKIQMRYHHDISKGVVEKAASLIRKGQSSIVMISDEAIYKGYEKIGIPRDVSENYVPIGCYEPVIMGKEDAMICACFMNMVKAAEFAITGGSDLLTGEVFGLVTPTYFESFHEFLQSFYAHLDSLVEHFIDNIDKQTKLSHLINPSPIYSGTITSCIKRGKDVFSGGMKYSNTTFKCYGIATTVDSLLAVKRLVYDEKRLTLSKLHQVLKDNWAGNENIRRMIQNSKNKYGNNLDEPDQLMHDIYHRLSDRIVNRKNARGGVYRLGADSIQINVMNGRRTGATADGRKACEPVSKNLCAVSGMEWKGVTALMHSVLKLDHDNLLGSEPLDIILHPSAVKGEEGLAAMIALIETYFNSGGIALQANVLDHETLVAAQKEPMKYQNLQVRLCGWNEYFVNLTDIQQNELIKQTRRA
jgi:trans-4-hydroxy-L-proline dehydratase